MGINLIGILNLVKKNLKLNISKVILREVGLMTDFEYVIKSTSN
jgi:hypothetical protein